MTGDGVLALAILGVAVLLLVTEWVRYDLVALAVLLALAVTGLVPAEAAVRSFGDPAVVTLAAVLVLSGGLYRTGVANLMGRYLLRLSGDRPGRITLLTMLTAGAISGFMFNLGVAALLLPVALEMSRRTGRAPSRLLIPLSYATLLGGTLTLIGTAPNILISGALVGAGLPPFHMFDFAPLGAVVLGVGVLYMLLVGQRLLPDRGAAGVEGTGFEAARGGDELRDTYDFAATTFTLRLPRDSRLDGRTLEESRLGRALGLGVLAVRRAGRTERAPGPGFRLRAGDEVVAAGRTDRLERLHAWGTFMERDGAGRLMEAAGDGAIRLAEAMVAPGASVTGHTLEEIDFRSRFLAHVVALRRGADVRRVETEELRLEPGDVLLLIGRRERLEQLRSAPEFAAVSLVAPADASRRYGLRRALLHLRVPEGSALEGISLERTRLREAFDLTVLLIRRPDGELFLPGPQSTLRGDDRLIVEGSRQDFEVLEALQRLEVRTGADVRDLESPEVGFAEVTLSPRASIVGKALRELFFREKYGLSVLAIWRGGRSYHSNVRLRSMPLQFGDALLVYGARSRLRLLARDPDFLVLGEEVRELFRARRAPVALAIMAGVVIAASTGALPIYLAAPGGVVAMVLTGCLTADEAYEFVQWRVIVLVGGLLVLGLALQETGAAAWIARRLVGAAAGLGPTAILGSVFLLTAVGAQVIPTTAVAVLMSPIALSSASMFGVSAHALLMAVMVGASSAFTTPFGHTVNLLVMGAGGYRVADYARVGTPLVALLLLVVLLVLPVFWPLVGAG